MDNDIFDLNGETPLLVAMRGKNWPCLPILLTSSSVNQQDALRRTPLMHAAKLDFPDIIELCVARGKTNWLRNFMSHASGMCMTSLF